jgi:uncharacterized protein YbaP (TraB family)
MPHDKARTAAKKHKAQQALDAARKLLEEARQEERATLRAERLAWEAAVGQQATRAGLTDVSLEELAQLFAWASLERTRLEKQAPWCAALATPGGGKTSSRKPGPADEAQAAD